MSSQLLRAENRFAWADSLCSSQVYQEEVASAMQWADNEIRYAGRTRCAMPQISPAHRSGLHAKIERLQAFLAINASQLGAERGAEGPPCVQIRDGGQPISLDVTNACDSARRDGRSCLAVFPSPVPNPLGLFPQITPITHLASLTAIC